jgi:iron(III) transport system permease protein
VAHLTALSERPFVKRRSIDVQTVLLSILFIVVALLIITPLVYVVIQSFQASKPGQPVTWGLGGWQAVLSDSSLKSAAWNTLSLSVVRGVLSGVLAVFIAWLLARTDVPGGKIFEFLFWLAFFLPALTVTLSWILLLDPQFGLLNQALRGIASWFGARPTASPSGPLTIYSFWGIVWLHVIGTSTAIKVMLLTPAFRNMNSALEEAARMAGASTFRSVFNVFIPLMLPTIVAVELLAVLNGLQAFEIERVVGARFNFFVFSTWIYDGLSQQTPRYDAIGAFSVVVMAVAITGILLQQRFAGRRSYATVAGHFQSQKLKLGRSRWPAVALLTGLTILILGVPLVFSLMGTFMKLFGFFIAQPWTLNQWSTAFSDRLFVGSLWNTIQLGLGTAIVGIILQALIAYVVVKTRYFARGGLDFVSWLPFTVPGIILSLGLLTMMLQPQLRWLYGTMASMVLALIIANMPFGVQILKGSLAQLGNELEEASLVCGGNRFITYCRVVLPLISPTLVVVGVISFIGAARNISQVALLSNTAIRPLSIMQLDYLAEGKYEVASVIATILLFVSLGLALIARVFGYKGVS